MFNAYLVALPDGTYFVHRKIHAFEHAEISSGDSYTVFDTPWGVRVGVLICWDNNLVENVRAIAETWVADDRMVTADLDLSLLPLATGRRWIRGRKPEMYRILTERLGHELPPQAARFSSEPVKR